MNGGIKLQPPPTTTPADHNAHLKKKKGLRVLPEGTPGLSQHQLHICSLVADTRVTPADPPSENAHQKPLPSRGLPLAANRLHMGH